MGLVEEKVDAPGDLGSHFLGALQFLYWWAVASASMLPNSIARKIAVRSPTKRIPSAPITRGMGLAFDFSIFRKILVADFGPILSSDSSSSRVSV